MENAIKTFYSQEFGETRTLDINGDIWFAGARL